MLTKTFYKLFESMHQWEKDVMLGKGHEYTQGSDDKLRNFKDIATRLNLTPIQVWAVYYLKHESSLEHWLNGGKISSGESIESRITDLRNYLALLRGLIDE